MGSKGSSTSKTNSLQQYTAAGAPQMYAALDRAGAAAQTPFQGYSADLIAGLTPTQRAAISGVNQNAGFALPFINEAAGYARAGAQSPIGDISQFMSPYTQNVVDATQRQFDAGNQVQQSQLLGNARAQSGVGGDRLAVAQSELAKNQSLAQAPVTAGLYSQGYNQALQAAQNFRQAQSNAAYGLGSLGTAGQNAALQGAGAQLSAGGVEQQTNQAGLSAAYQQFLRQIGYPVQMSQFLTGSTAALAPSLGGTQAGQSNTETTPAQPSILGQIAGLGMAAAGLMSGNPMMAMGGAKGATGGGKGSSGGGSFAPQTGPTYAGDTMGAFGGVPFPIIRAAGGAVDGGGGEHDILRRALAMASMIRRHRNGGAVLDAMRGHDSVFSVPGFAFGGEPILLPGFEAAPNDRVSDAFGVANDAIASGDFDPQGMNAPPQGGFGAPAGIPLPRARPAEAPGMAEDDAPPPNAAPTAGFAVPGASAAQPGMSGEFAPALREAMQALKAPRPQGGFAQSPGAALMAAGLGMLASGSPFPGVAIGQGGLKGLATLEGQRENERKEADAAARQHGLRGNLAYHGMSAEQAAQRLLQSAKQHADTLAETTRHHTVQESLAQKPTLTVTGRDEYGNPKYGIFDPRTQSVKDVPPTGGTPRVEGAPVSDAGPAVKPPTPPPAQLSEDTELPKNAMLVSGDDAFLMGLPSGDQKMVKAMVEGRQPPPPGKALATPYWRRMVELATTYDPSFDMGRWSARVQTRKNFATGVEGRTIRSLNTVANHIGELDKAGEALNNWKTGTLGPGSKPLNEVTRWLRDKGQDPRLTDFETAASAVSTELEKAFRGSQTAISGIKEWRKSMDPAMSPEQMKSANKMLAKLLLGQLEGLAGQYAAGMGKNADPLTILQPQAAKTFQKLLGTLPEGATGEKPAAKTEGVAGAPQRPAGVPDGSQYSPSRKQWRDKSGKIYDADGKVQ